MSDFSALTDQIRLGSITVDSPASFLSNIPSSKMIRQILGAVAEFQKDELVGRLQSARIRKRAEAKRRGYVTLEGKGKCEVRKSLAQKTPELVQIVRRLARKNPRTKKRMSVNKIALVLYEMGFRTRNGTPINKKQAQRLLQRG